MFGQARPLRRGEVKNLKALNLMAQYIPPKWDLKGGFRRKDGSSTDILDNVVLFEGQEARAILDLEVECKNPKLVWSGTFDFVSEVDSPEIEAEVELTYLGNDGFEGEFHRVYSLGNLDGRSFTLSDLLEISLESLQGGKVTLKVVVGGQVARISSLVLPSETPETSLKFLKPEEWNLEILETRGLREEFVSIPLEETLSLSLEDLTSRNLKLTLEGILREDRTDYSLTIFSKDLEDPEPPFEALNFRLGAKWVLPTLTLSAWSESHHKYSITKSNRVRETFIEYETLIQSTTSDNSQSALLELKCAPQVPPYTSQVDFHYELYATNGEKFEGSFGVSEFPYSHLRLLSEGELILGSLEGSIRYSLGIYDLSTELFEPDGREKVLPEVATLIDHYGAHYPTLLLCEKLEVSKGTAKLTPGPLEGSPWGIQSIVRKMFDPELSGVKLEPGDLETLLVTGHPLVYKVEYETTSGATISEETSLIVMTSDKSSKPSSASHTIVLPALLPSKEEIPSNDRELPSDLPKESLSENLPTKGTGEKVEPPATPLERPRIPQKILKPKRRFMPVKGHFYPKRNRSRPKKE